MSDQHFGSIASDIANSDPRDHAQRAKSLEQIRELRKVVEFAGAKSLGGFLDAAMLLTEYMPQLDEVPPEQTLQIVTRLVRMVEVSFQEALGVTEDRGKEEAKDEEDSHGTIHLETVSAHLDSDSPDRSETVSPEPPEPVLPETIYLSLESPVSSLPLEMPKAPIPESSPPTTADVLEEVLLGEILVKLGTIDPEDVEKALQVQAKYGLRFGEALVQLGKALPSEVKKGLDIQNKIREARQPGSSAKPKRAPKASPGSLRLAGDRREEPRAALPAGISLANEVNQVEELMIGDLLVQHGVITREQLKLALSRQRASGHRVGESLVEMGAATWDQVKKALRKQEIRRMQMKARYR